MSRGFFVTGTDTEIGKTWAAVALMSALRRSGQRVTAMKPVAAGTEQPADAELLAAACTSAPPAHWLNPYALATPASPHIASELEGVSLDFQLIRRRFEQLTDLGDSVVVEGGGGWLAPLAEQWLVSDLAVALELPVILVVGLRLGCLSHALLTARQIAADGVHLAGWIGNTLPPAMAHLEANMEFLRQHLPAPCLGILPILAAPEDGAQYLDVTAVNTARR